MTRAAVTAIARRHGLDLRGTDALLEEYAERMAIATIEGGHSEADADVIAMADCERWAAVLSRSHSSNREPASLRLGAGS